MPESQEPENRIVGWDLGGAHVKAALLTSGGKALEVVQIPCPLWQGIERLDAAVAEALRRLGPARRHTVTMTGELTDFFADRGEGVRRLIDAMSAALPDCGIRIFAGRAGLLPPPQALKQPGLVASANWQASARLVAKVAGEGLLVDIGSTTTDIVPVAGGASQALGTSDFERMVHRELVYTGVVRTPVMATVQTVSFKGARVGLMAELFATMADVHRLCGTLPQGADLMAAADGGGKSEEESARRLARMLGCDVEDADMAAWRQLARDIACCQLQRIEEAARHVLGRRVLTRDAPLIGAGCGRFLVCDLARRLDRPYTDFAKIVDFILEGADPGLRDRAANCAPALAVAYLALEDPPS